MQPIKKAINASTRLYGIFGDPVEHSLSPLLHNTQFSLRGINAVYLAFRVEREMLALAFEAIRSLGICGVNITIPFKESAIDYTDEVPEDVDRRIGAINTVVNKNGKLIGYNTDSPGFLKALSEELIFNPAGKKVLVLGAGGASRSVFFSLARAHAEKIFLYNRTAARAEGLGAHVEEFFPETEIEVVSTVEALRQEAVDLVVNATSCGMNPQDPTPIDLKCLKSVKAVYDLVYAPSQTLLLKQAVELGIANANGLGMLANQAALSFELWTGEKQGVRESMLETLNQWQR